MSSLPAGFLTAAIVKVLMEKWGRTGLLSSRTAGILADFIHVLSVSGGFHWHSSSSFSSPLFDSMNYRKEDASACWIWYGSLPYVPSQAEGMPLTWNLCFPPSCWQEGNTWGHGKACSSYFGNNKGHPWLLRKNSHWIFNLGDRRITVMHWAGSVPISFFCWL